MSKTELTTQNAEFNTEKDVLVPFPVYGKIITVLKETEKLHTKFVTSDKHSYFHKSTHKPISAKNANKLGEEKLNKDYYQAIDLEKTKESIRVDRDELGTATMILLSELVGVFEHNVKQGNAKLKEEVPAPPLTKV